MLYLRAESHFLPWVLLWDPFTQFASLVQGGMQCPVCKAKITNKHWRVGHSQGTQPRLLYSFDKTMLLVGVMYTCENQHKLLSYDPRITQLLQSKDSLPFVLGHRAGFTRDFFNNLVNHMSQGTSFLSLQQLIRSSHEALFDTIETAFWESVRREFGAQSDDAINGPEKLARIESIIDQSREVMALYTPSKHILHDCFLIWFLENEDYYSSQLCRTTSQEWISLDHTFKLASNIGYWRNDGKWIHVYDSACFVLNEHGQVLTWKFTKGTSFAQIQSQLDQLQDRLRSQGNLVKEVLIDNCCNLRSKILNLFGPETKVLLDLFHAEARIVKTLSKTHSHYQQCLSEFRLIFREPDDLGKERSKATPGIDDLKTNIHHFTEKWKDVKDYNGRKLFTEKTLAELQALHVHIDRGCLSGIRPGSGTNQNEALHQYLNRYFKLPKMGVDTAFALIMTLVVLYNIRHSEEITLSAQRTRAAAAKSYFTEGVEPSRNVTHEVFGFSREKVKEDTWILGKLSTHKEAVDCFSNTIGMESQTICDSQGHLTLHCVMQILSKATYLDGLTHAMIKRFNSSALFNYEFVPFMSSIPALFHHNDYDPLRQSMDQHLQRLDNRLAAFGYKRVTVPGDGNCFFAAYATQLHALVERSPESEVINHLSTLGIDLSIDKEDIIQQLRTMLVSEWSNNPEKYQPFLTESAVCDEAQNFLQSGYFNHELGNTMPLAMANLTGIPLIIISSLENHGIFRIDPENPHTSDPIMLSFNQSGVGHYDAVTNISEEASRSATCRCGVNNKSKSSFSCITVVGQYSSRCKCLKAKQACSISCGCVSCANPHGKHHEEFPRATGSKRVRQRHDLALLPPVKKFMAERGESVERGPWTMYEYLVFEGILQHHLEEGVPITPQSLHGSYEQVANMVEMNNDLKVPLGRKTVRQIASRLQRHFEIGSVFQTLFKQQISFNVINSP